MTHIIKTAQIKSIIAFLLMFISSSAFAETNWYKVEVLIFAHLNNDAMHDEVWPEEPGLPSLDNTLEPITQDSSALMAANSVDPIAYALLAKEQLSLSKERLYMKRSRYYRPLLHLGWMQPGFTKNKSRYLHLISGQDNYLYAPGKKTGSRSGLEFKLPEIEGKIRVYLDTYLHVNADLLYSKGSKKIYTEDEFGQSAEPVQFRLQENRKLRLEELHYLDHPLFGVLVYIHRAEKE